MPSVNAVVIGAGIVGASVAYRLAEAGAAVRVIEMAAPGLGTTSRSFAWANANQKLPRAYFDFNFAGMAEHRRIAEELAPAPWYHPDGNLVWAAVDGFADLQKRVERLHGWGYAVEWLTSADATELEPALASLTPETPVAWFPDEAWIDAPDLTNRLIVAAVSHGATIHTGAIVNRIEQAGGKVTGVSTQTGDRIAADVVVNAAGPSAVVVADLADISLPFAPVPGLLLRLFDPRNPFRRIVHGPRTNVRPDGDGFFILQSAELDEHLGERRSISFDDPLVTEILDRGRAEFPILEGTTLVETRVGVRPITADEYPSVGAVTGLGGYYEAVTHSGVTLGPLIGRLLTQEITTGRVDALLAPYRPDRLRQGSA